MKKIRLSLYVLILSSLLCSCFSLKTGAIKSGKKLYESFYIGEEGMQYFIKPLEFISKNNKTIYIDFTFRYKDSINNNQKVAINYSIESLNPIGNISQIEIRNNSQTEVLQNIKSLFSEKKGKKFIYRFSSNLSLVECRSLFRESSWKIILKNQKFTEVYTSTKKTEKSINKLNEVIFSLMKE